MNEAGLAITLMPPTIAVSIAPRAQRFHGLMQRDQGRRARGVDGEARPVQPVNIRDAVGENRDRGAGREMRVSDRLIAEERMTVIGLRSADVNADFGIRD